MYDFKYVSRAQAAPIKAELIDMIHEVQDILREDFTFRYDFIGSSSRNMITCDYGSNIGFDFDVNLEVNDEDEEFTAEDIKHKVMNAFNKVVKQYGYGYCEDSTRVITIKFIDHDNSRILHSCDFAIIYNYKDRQGHLCQQYIRFNKEHGSYTWEQQPHGYNLTRKVQWIKKNEYWDDVLDLYIDKKNFNDNPDKHSRALYAETINEICQRYGYHEK